MRTPNGMPVLLVAGAILLLSAPSIASIGGSVQPGDVIMTEGIGCTAGFVFDGTGAQAGDVFLSTASHCSEATGDVVRDGNGVRIGTVVHRGWGTDDGGSRADDWALILVDEGREAGVRAEVAGHPNTPTGYTTDDTWAPFDQLTISGHGMVFGTTQVTREERPGLLVAHEEGTYAAQGPWIFGDSGGPVSHIDGRAVGLVSGPDLVVRCCAGASPGYEVAGPTVANVLDQAALAGFDLELRTV